MKHARADYDRIQDPEHKIPQDEPVFLLRAQDRVAPYVVEVWAMMAEMIGADEGIVEAAFEHSTAMCMWQKNHIAKIPDMPSELR